MSNTAIQVDNLSKLYHIGGNQEKYRTLRDTLSTAASAPYRRVRAALQRNKQSNEDKAAFWALKDISFEIKRGEVIGVIGRNGAGKSTLLRILSRITEPTSGRAEIHGRVGSLLEVGTGFHPELTGRENIRLNGAILGMKRAEIERRFDEIVDFAEVENFIDTPVKHYSSGMYMRLAFAVAAHMEPEILLVDEVLAVGDAQFQKKCLGKMGDVANEGRTVLFVSHNMTAMESFCKKVLWLEQGKTHAFGESPRVIADYLRSSIVSSTEQKWHSIETAPGNQTVRLHYACVKPALPTLTSITTNTPLLIEFEYWNLKTESQLDIAFHLFTEQGILAFNPASFEESVWHGRPCPKGLFRSICYIPGDLLNDGTYTVQLVIAREGGLVELVKPDLLTFNVLDIPESRGSWYGKWPGAVRPRLKWSTEFLGELNDNRSSNDVTFSAVEA